MLAEKEIERMVGWVLICFFFFNIFWPEKEILIPLLAKLLIYGSHNCALKMARLDGSKVTNMYELKNAYTHTANIVTCFSKNKNGIPNYKFINEMHLS
jgi:hypothetical protein